MNSLKEKILNLQNKCYNCQKCQLGTRKVENLDPHVFASGKPNANLMFLGEAPGKTETELKIPLVGAAGRFFEKNILSPIGLNRDEVYITNSVLCRPNEKNRTPFFGEIEECLEFLDEQIVLVSPKLIVTLGSVPLYAACKEQGITSKRGQLRWSRIWSNGNRFPVFPMFHPAFCLRNSGISETREDVQTLRQLNEDIVNGKEIVI